MKKSIFLFIILVGLTSFNVNAQLGKALKNAGKVVASTAETTAGGLAKDAAVNNLSANVVLWLDKNNTVSADDSPYTTRLASIVGEKFTKVDDLALYFKVFENPEANILALPDGFIRVYSGLLDLFENDDELLAVIAIQIAHIANKDVNATLLKAANEGQATTAASAQLEKLLSLNGEKMGTFVNELIQVPYTDDQNKAADKYAATLLKKNGKSAEALVAALTKLAELEAADKEAGENGELSPAYKYNRVNSNNKVRSSLAKSY